LRTSAIPDRFCGGDSLRRGAISSVCTELFTFNINGEGELRGQPSTPCSPGKMAIKAEHVCVVVVIAAESCLSEEAFCVWQVCAAPCYRHSGKARRGDGNDITPNPSKLYATGKELRKLARLINAMCPAAELPTAIRARTLREKNKYASRICRLKKKAQHEANKIKLYGLEQEHRMYMLHSCQPYCSFCGRHGSRINYPLIHNYSRLFLNYLKKKLLL